MAWNGRNESILGATSSSAPATDAGDSVKTASNNQAKDAVEAKTVAAPPAPLVPSVWNGRHQKILKNRAPSKGDTASETSSVASCPTTASSSALPTGSLVSKKEQPVVISPHPKVDSKEDASTAGSSITNTTIGEGSTLEVKVVTTGVTPTASSKSEKKDSSNKSTSAGSNTNDAGTTAPTTVTNDSTNHPERQHNHANSTSSGANAINVNTRRPEPENNNKEGRRGQNGSNQWGNSNNNGRHTGGKSRSDRRRGPNNGNQPKCHFFDQGSCNRGKECPYKHDTTNVGAAPLQRRSGTYPHAHNGTNVTASAFVPARRAFDPHKASAISLTKGAQDKEDRSAFLSSSRANIIRGQKKAEEAQAAAAGNMDEDPPLFSIDVECIATGYGSCAKGINDGCGNEGRNRDAVPSNQYNDRSHRYPGRVAMVDRDGYVLADIVVRPPRDGEGVTSYLTPLTGLTAELCLGSDAKSLDEAVDIIKDLLPKNSVLVGQSIGHDVEWLGLVPGKDFGCMLDISQIFRQRLPAVLNQAASVLREKEERGGLPSSGDQSNSSDPKLEGKSCGDPSSDEHLGFATRYRNFSLRHVCLNLLGEDIQSGMHNPILDAQYSLTLFHKYRNSSVTRLRIVRDGLHRAPATPGFAAENSPVIDGVCVSAAGYPHKRAGRRIWKWYVEHKKQES